MVREQASQKDGDQSPTSRLALAALALGAFVIGTAELVVVGVLDLVARDFSVSVSTAGQMVTAYALGISIGGPVITALTTRLGRRFLLRLALAVFVAGNMLALWSSTFGLLLVARVVTGSVHGLFIGVASVVAAALVPPERRGQAVSMVFGGIAVATVVGVPLGTLAGQALSWQVAFGGIVGLGAIALLMTLAFVPPVRSSGAGGFAAQARYAFAPRVLAMLGVGVLLLGGQFTAFTYLTPYLERVTGISGGLTSVFLLAYGLASAVGTVVGGRLADRGAATTMLVANAVLILALGVLYVAGGAPPVALIALAVWGLAGFGLVPAFQVRVIGLAGAGGDLAATLGASAVNIGIAAGAMAGGWALEHYGPSAAVLTGLIIVAVALPATWGTRWLTAPEAGEPAAAADEPRTDPAPAAEAP